MSRIAFLIVIVLSFSRVSAQKFLAHFSSVTEVVAFDDNVYFAGDDDVHGVELWMSDGTREGTRLVKDIFPGSVGSMPDNLTVVNGTLFFTATSPQSGRELWKSDGTTAGTVLVKDIYPGPGNHANPWQLTIFQTQLYFEASNDGFNHQLYKTDGTGGGTVVVKELGIAQIAETAVAGSLLYFVAGGATLWKSDGTTAGTAAIPVDGNPFVRELTPAGNTLYFTTASGDRRQSKLYKREGTQPPALLRTFNGSGENSITDVTSIGSAVYFNFANDYDAADTRDALWTSNGTAGGTQLVKSFPLDDYAVKNTMKNFVAFQGKLFFRQGKSLNGELWTSDGTAGGTARVSDVTGDASEQAGVYPVVSNGLLYFSGDGELWSSDGTTSGTREHFDINQTSLSGPHDLADADGTLFLVAADEYGTALWTNVPAPEIAIRDNSTSTPLFSQAVLDFGSIAIDDCGTATLSVSNAGAKELVLYDATASGKDYFLGGTLPATLAPGQSHTFEVSFVPFTTGMREGTLVLRNTDSNESELVINMRGVGAAAVEDFVCSALANGELKKKLLSDATNAAIAISSNAVNETSSAGSLIGQVSVAQGAGSYQFSLVEGEGDDDNAHFTLTGNNLYTTTTFDYDNKSILTVRVRATQADSEWESPITLVVVPSNLPVASGEPCAPAMKKLSGGIQDVEFNQQGELFAVGDQGKILRSVNIGNTWLPVNSGVTKSLNKVIFKASAGFAIGSDVLLKSDDHGVTWFQLYTPFTVTASGVFFLDAQNGIAAGADGSFFQTTDGGRQWSFTGDDFPQGPVAMWFWDLNNGIASTSFGGLMRTSDGGASWTETNAPVVGPGVTFKSIHFTDEDHGFLLSNTGLYKSDDGGAEWYAVSGVSGFGLQEIRFVDLNNAYIIGGSWSAEVFVSSSGGNNWDAASMDPMSVARGVAVNPSGTTVVIAGNNAADPFFSAPGHVVMSAATGSLSGWQIRNALRSQTFNAIDFPTTSTGFLFGELGAFKTIDGGNAWQALAVPATVDGATFSDASTGFIATGHNLYKTTTGGGTWVPAFDVPSDGPAYLTDVIHVAGDVYVAYSDEGVIYRTSNGGTTWPVAYDQPLNQLKEVTFSSVQTGYGLDLLGKVIKTTNGGAGWSTVYTHPVAGEFFNTISFLNDATGFIGGKDGMILKTTNGGTSWAPVFSGIPSTIVRFIFETATVGYAFTDDGLVYQTRDGATTWSSFDALSYIGLSDVDKVSDRIYFAGSYGNLGKIDLPPGPTMPGYISGDQVVCVGDAVDLHVAEADGAAYYTWQIPGVSFTSHDEWVAAKMDQAGTFTASVKKTDACGTSSSRTLSVTVEAPPQPVIGGATEVVAATTESYFVESPGAESRFSWIVSDALGSDPEADLVEVLWGNADGQVAVVETDQVSGCRGNTVLVVSVDPATIVGLGPDGNVIEATVLVYPNPTSDLLMVSSSYRSGLEIKLFDLSGRLMNETRIDPNADGVLKVSHLPAGLYLLELVSLSGDSKTVKKIIKR